MRAALRLGAGALLLTACGSSSSSLFSRPPSAYLLTLDELHTPGFTVVEPAHEPHPGATLQVATARYFRSVPELATANGPIDVRTTVTRCDSVAQASADYAAEVKHLDAQGGETAESAGALGDVAHADELHTTSDGVGLVEVTLTWRTLNLLSVLVVRERDTGGGLADALILAHAQQTGVAAR